MFSDFICVQKDAGSAAEKFLKLFSEKIPFEPAENWIKIKHNPVRDVFKKDDCYIKVDHRKFHTFKHEYSIAQALKTAGIPVVEHLFCARIGTENFLVTRELANAVTASDFLDTPVDKTAFIAAFTALMEQWQTSPFEHTDPHFGNLLYLPESNQLFLVDVHDIKRRLFPGCYRKDIIRFIFNLRGSVPHSTIIDLMKKFQAADPEKIFNALMKKEFLRIKQEWQKRKQQLFNAYPKFSIRQDQWLIRTAYKEDFPVLPEEFTANASAEFAASMFLTLLQIPHRRCIAVDLERSMVKRATQLASVPDAGESAALTAMLTLCDLPAHPEQYRLYNRTAALDDISAVAELPFFTEG